MRFNVNLGLGYVAQTQAITLTLINFSRN